VVFGRAAAITINENSKPGQSQPELPKDAGMEALANLDRVRFANGDIKTAE